MKEFQVLPNSPNLNIPDHAKEEKLKINSYQISTCVQNRMIRDNLKREKEQKKGKK